MRIGPWIGFNAARTQDGRQQIDGACAFLMNGSIYSIPEERLSRIKHDGNVWRSLRQGMATFDLKPDRVTRICVSTSGEHVPGAEAQVYLRTDGRLSLDDIGFSSSVVRWVESHHASHAWEAILSAHTVGALRLPALVYIADRVGQPGEHQSVYLYGTSGLVLLSRDQVARGVACGVGETYDRVTRHLGWRENVDCGKTMALAGLVPIPADVTSPIFFELRGDHIGTLLPADDEDAASILSRFCPRDPSAQVRQAAGAVLAARLQAELEATISHIVRRWVDRVGPSMVLFGGGVATNCKLIGSVARCFPELCVQGTLVPGDTGQGIGNLVGLMLPRQVDCLRPKMARRVWGSGLCVGQRLALDRLAQSSLHNLAGV